MKKLLLWISTLCLTSCSLVQFQPIETLNEIQPKQGYRLQQAIERSGQDQTLVIMMFSGGGTRAAGLGYGVLAHLHKHPVRLNGKRTTLVQAADLVYGVSGGSVLAAYYALHGADTIPQFEHRFLKQDFQRMVAKQSLSLANAPRLASPQFGRGDLLQEQLENTLFGKATFGDLQKANRPFAVISATDMSLGNRIDFIQESFDVLCLNLSKMPISRAVAASSAVPFVFSPIVLNNHGGNCQTSPLLQQINDKQNVAKHLNDKEMRYRIHQYQDSKTRPYIHLLDGGLTDNLGMRGVLDLQGSYFGEIVAQSVRAQNVKRIILINVNAQNQVASTINQSPNVPKFGDVLSAIINIPIDQNSQTSLQQMRLLQQAWQEQHPDIQMNFISVNLLDLPESPLRKRVLNLPTSFYLPSDDVDALKQSASILLEQSPDWQKLLRETR